MVHIQILVGPRNKVFGTGSQTDLTRGFIVLSVVQATIPVTLVGTAFAAPQCWFLRVGMSEAKKINTGRAGALRFVRIWVQHGVSQLNVTELTMTLPETNKKLMRKASGIVDVVVRD